MSAEENKWMAVLKLRCPQCREGKVFKGLLRMNEKCPHCGLVFEREPGYFLGAMYLSYGMGGIVLVSWVLLLNFLTAFSLYWIFVSAVLLLWLCTPLIFRYSRVLYMYLERNTLGD